MRSFTRPSLIRIPPVFLNSPIHVRVVTAAAVLLAILLSAPMNAAEAQTNQDADKGSIVGTVTDASHAPVPGAEVILTNVTAGGVRLGLPIDANGEFSASNLSPGYYSLTVKAPGFADKVWDTLSVKPGGKLQLDAVLNLASAAGAAPAPEPVAAAQEPAAAAGDEASISGTVTDQTQAVVPDAKAVLTSSTGEKKESPVNAKGVYSFTHIKPGDYKLTISAPNFADHPFETIKVMAGMELTLDASLQPASASENINVVGETPNAVETQTATSTATITEVEVKQTPLNGRIFSSLIALAPGVSDQTGQDEKKVGVQGSVKYSVNGGRVEYNTFEIDGSDVLNTGLNGASSVLMVSPSLDAIQDVKVITANYGAQYGRTASGTVQVTTKSGTGNFHGNLYDFVRNEWFNSRNYFDVEYSAPVAPGSTVPPKVFGNHAPLYRRQDFGGTIGGPLYIPGVFNTKKDRTFFFFSEEYRLEKTPIDYTQAVPGLKERGLILSANGVQPNYVQGNGGIYRAFDFGDVCPPAGASFSRSAFPDCPVSQFGTPLSVLGVPGTNYGVDKNAIAMVDSNLIPLPNSPVGCNILLPNVGSSGTNLDPQDPNHCYVTAVSPSMYWREDLFRIDHTLTSKIRLMFRYAHDEWNTVVLNPQWGDVRNAFPTVENRFYGPGISLVANVSDTITPSLLNTTVVSYTNSGITLIDQNGPGGARFQRNPSIDQPLVGDPANPGECNPLISVDPLTQIPECGIGYIFNNGFGGKMPGLNFVGTNAAYGGEGFGVDPSYMPWGHTNPTYAIRDDVGKSIGNGKHTIQFGAQYVYSQRNQNNNVIGAASGDTQGLLTFSNLSHSTGNAFADFLIQEPVGTSGQYQGFIQSFTQDSTNRRYYQRYQLAEPYFQDDWKVTPRLTLNLGFRASLFGTYRENNRNAWNWVPSNFGAGQFSVDPLYGELLYQGSPVQASQLVAGSPVVQALGLVQCGAGGIPIGCMKGHLFNPAPRIGFAWDPKGDGKTSIRGGYGIFFEHGTGNESNTGSLEASAPLVLSMTQSLPLNYPCIGGVGYGVQFNSVNPCQSPLISSGLYPNAIQPQVGDAYPIDVTGIPTKATWPYAQQWSFGIQRELSRAVVLNVAYVGSQGTHLTVERQLNQLQPLPLNQNPFGPNEPLTLADCTNAPPGTPSGNNPGDGATPFLLGGGALVSPASPAYVHLQAACTNPNIPNVNSLPGHAYPGLGRVLSLENLASSKYHALQVTVRHVSGPLTAGVSYSYSHSIDNSSDRSDPVLVNSFDLRQNRASSNFDERHLLNVNYVYRLPLRNFVDNVRDWSWDARADRTHDKGCCAASALLLDGWEVDGVTLAQTGTPFTVINSAGNTGISLTDNAGVASGYGIAASYPDVNKSVAATPFHSNPQSFGPLVQNPALFVAPRGLTFGNAGRNYLNNPFRINFDLSLVKHTKIKERGDLEFRAEAFNIFNHTQFRLYDPDNPGRTGNNIISCYAGPSYSAGFEGSGADCVTGASFLHPIDAHRPRTIQLGLKLGF